MASHTAPTAGGSGCPVVCRPPIGVPTARGFLPWRLSNAGAAAVVHVASTVMVWGCYHPHPSQNRTCRFLASGSSRESFARRGVLMDDPGGREWMSLEDFGEAVPWEPAPSIPSR